MTTIAPLDRIALRRSTGRPISLIVVEVAAGMLICRDTPHKAGAFGAVLVIDPATAETAKGRTTFRPLAGTAVYRTVPEAVAAVAEPLDTIPCPACAGDAGCTTCSGEGVVSADWFDADPTDDELIRAAA